MENENVLIMAPGYMPEVSPPEEYQRDREVLKKLTCSFEDLQYLRINVSNRAGAAERNKTAFLDSDKEIIKNLSKRFKQAEDATLRDVGRQLKKFKVYNDYFLGVRAVGPRIAGLLISEIDIFKTKTPGHLLKFCGLAVNTTTNQADRRIKGQKISYNPRLKDNILHVLGDNFIKLKAPYSKIYYNQKNRRNNQILDKCQNCDGTGSFLLKNKKQRCNNCNGTGGPAPWGKSDKHRHLDAKRKMCKIFLQDTYKNWRTIMGLPVAETYEAAKLGIVHGEHVNINNIRLAQLLAKRPNNYSMLSDQEKRLINIKLGIPLNVI